MFLFLLGTKAHLNRVPYLPNDNFTYPGVNTTNYIPDNYMSQRFIGYTKLEILDIRNKKDVCYFIRLTKDFYVDWQTGFDSHGDRILLSIMLQKCFLVAKQQFSMQKITLFFSSGVNILGLQVSKELDLPLTMS